jgi:hypothetical protein
MKNYDLQSLATQKSYDELSDQERDFVLDNASQAEYEQLRRIIVRAGALHNETKPSARLRQQLLSQMAVQQPPKNQNWYETPIALWKVAAITTIASAAIFTIIPNTEPKIIEKWSERTVHTTDTVYLPAPTKIEYQTRWRDRIVYVPIAAAPSNQIPPLITNHQTDTIYLQASDLTTYPASEGVAASKNPAFWSFLNNGR